MRLALWMLLVVGCGAEESSHSPELDLSSRVSYVTAAWPERVPVTTLPAEVRSSPDGAHHIGPGVDGRLVDWLVTPGTTVEAGDALARLNSPALSELAGRASEASSAVAEAQVMRDLRAAEVARGVASESDLRAAESVLTAATAARRTVLAALSSQRDTTTSQGGELTWRAPIGGVVHDFTCSLGTISASDTCLSLIRPDGAVVDVRVPERHLALLETSTSAKFTSADGRVWSLTELSRAPVVDAHSRSLLFRFAVDGDTAPLVGMSGRATLFIAPVPGLHQVPATALTRMDGVPTLFVREGDATSPREVQVIGQEGEDIVVSGLADQDEVAVRGVYLLKSLAFMEEE